METELVRQVWRRAAGCCEYCQLAQGFDGRPFDVDHIISRKHHGPTIAGNLALSCFRCNSFKGSDIGGLYPKTRKLTGLFPPRRHKWARHFRWQGGYLVGRTPVGRVTVAVLQINDPFRVELREELIQEGVFPPNFQSVVISRESPWEKTTGSKVIPSNLPWLRRLGGIRYHTPQFVARPQRLSRRDPVAMPEIRPFRAVRYDLAKVGTLSDVVAPPYDVIDPVLQHTLYNSSPYNIIRLELNREEVGDAPGMDRYARAASYLKDWRRQGILSEDPHPALYVYHQTFSVDGKSFTRKGFLARVRLEPFGSGRIFPHEQTLSGPKADRLSLYRATGYNLSPIFGLYPDDDNSVLRAIEAGIKDRTPLEATDHLGVVNQLWAVTDLEAFSTASGLIGTKPAFIADGHHRYETGLAYRDELQASGELSGPDDPANYCLMMLVSMSDPGLLILPTHRLVSNLPDLTGDELKERLSGEFAVEETGTGPDGAKAAWEEIESGGFQDMLGFGTVADGRWFTARLRSDATMDRIVPEHSVDWRNLGVSILHELVLKHLLGDLGTATCRYVHMLDEVLESTSRQECNLACLVPPAAMADVEAIASNLEKMPPKSTYFYPKLLTGLVLNPLR